MTRTRSDAPGQRDVRKMDETTRQNRQNKEREGNRKETGEVRVKVKEVLAPEETARSRKGLWDKMEKSKKTNCGERERRKKEVSEKRENV